MTKEQLKTGARSKRVYRPATADRWPDLEALFGERGACGGCWCMVWRLPRAEYEAGKNGGNRKALRKLTQGRVPPGILAYEGGAAIGWCAVAPREAYPYLERSRVLRPLDEEPVWSVSCLFVAKPYRRRGVSSELLREAVRFARRHGARIVEGYPVIPNSDAVPAVFAWTGTYAAFVAAGFEEAGRHAEKRPIMRTTP